MIYLEISTTGITSKITEKDLWLRRQDEVNYIRIDCKKDVFQYWRWYTQEWEDIE